MVEKAPPTGDSDALPPGAYGPPAEMKVFQAQGFCPCCSLCLEYSSPDICMTHLLLPCRSQLEGHFVTKTFPGSHPLTVYLLSLIHFSF